MIINFELQLFLEKYILKKFSLTYDNKHFGCMYGCMGNICQSQKIMNIIP